MRFLSMAVGLALGVLLAVTTVATSSAIADPTRPSECERPATSSAPTKTSEAAATAGASTFHLGLSEQTRLLGTAPGDCAEPPTNAELLSWSIHRSLCIATTVGLNAPADEICPSGKRPSRQITLLMVLRAFQKIELPKPALSIQPPGGKTLVNFDTIFSTDADSFRRTVHLLGSRVQLDITPVSYVWTYGDGTTETTSSPGVEWSKQRPMSDYLIHTYEDADVTMKPQVSVAYSARFRVGKGPWRDVSGTVTSDGKPVDLRVVEGDSVLLGTS